MIRSLEIENFFSFRDPAKLDLTVQPKAGERELFFDDPSGGRVNRVLAVFGANASGKTQWLKALGFLQWLLLDSVQLPTEQSLRDLVKPFLFGGPTTAQPSRLVLEFSVGEFLYRYEVEVSSVRIHAESLKVRQKRWNIVFSRAWDAKKESYAVSDATEGWWRDTPQRANASMFSWGIRKEAHAHAEAGARAKEIERYFRDMRTNLNYMGRTSNFDPLSPRIREAAEFFEHNPDHLDWVNQRLSHFDLGLSGVEIVKNQSGINGQVVYSPMGVHGTGNDKTLLSLFEESRGTQSLFILLRYLLPVLKSGGVAVLDEFETGLHSHMLPVLVDLFLGKHNPKGAQLIFTCHSDYLLTHLEKYQVAFTGKDDAGVSSIWRGDDTGIRNQENLYAKYHAGKLGGVPSF